jgi:hypothetical protein
MLTVGHQLEQLIRGRFGKISVIDMGIDFD